MRFVSPNHLPHSPAILRTTSSLIKIIKKFYSVKMSGKYRIVMVRHGESEWNQKNLFCGWFDANLSEQGG